MDLSTFPILETQRLWLRQLIISDAAQLLQLLSDVEVTKDMGIDPLVTVEQAEELIQFLNDLYQQNTALRWGIIRKEDNILIGTCGYNGWETQRGSRGEIGYDLGKAYWRQGYMTEVLKVILPYGFKEMAFNRIEALTNLDATPSIKLLLSLGFREEGILRGYAYFHGTYWDQRIFSLLQEEWLNR